MSRDAYGQPKKDIYEISTYVEAVNHFLKSYATNVNVAEATAETSQLVKLTKESAVQFADAVRPKEAKRGNANHDECIKEVFTDGLSLTICSIVFMFRSRNLRACLTELA